jgi:3D (Asp-Asp-Asp) domain-containing protein
MLWNSRRAPLLAWAAIGVFLGPGMRPAEADEIAPPAEQTLVVNATAYNSLQAQTSAQPNIGAWGDRLEPGMKAIAVSRDLLERGLKRGIAVTIDGLPGEYLVLDKMAARWRNKIDIYMGEDVQAARRWGVREVTIRWIDMPRVSTAP